MGTSLATPNPQGLITLTTFASVPPSAARPAVTIATAVADEYLQLMGVAAAPANSVDSTPAAPSNASASSFLGVEVEAGAAQVEPAGHGSSRQMGSGRGLPRRQVVVTVAAVLEAMVEVRYVFDMTSTD